MADPLLETDLPYRIGSANLTDGRGRTVPTDECLVNMTPGEGWDVVVSVRGVPSPVSGTSPLRVVDTLAKRLESNGLEGVSVRDLWINLNIMWMGRVNPRHHRVAMADVVHAVTAVVPDTAEDSTQILHPASEWSGLAWGTLELYLCREDYCWYTFNTLISEMAVIFSPAVTPTLGDGGLHLRMVRQLVDLRADPVYSRDEARKWLTKTRSKVMDEDYKGSPLWSR
jgi:hypothetical protein